MALDVLGVMLIFGGYQLLLDEALFFAGMWPVFWVASAMVLIGRLMGFYDSFTRFFNFHELVRYGALLFLSSVVLLVVLGDYRIERLFVLFFSMALATIPYRFVIKYLFSLKAHTDVKTALLYGAGERGVFLKRSFYNSPHFKIVGFVDDAPQIKGRKIDGVYVYGLDDKLLTWMEKKQVKHVIFTTTKMTSARKEYLLNYFKDLRVQTYNLPPTDVWAQRPPSAAQLKKIRIEDLLTRAEIGIDVPANQSFYAEKSILVTGGAGSIGSELVRQLVGFVPKKVVVLDINETALFHLQEELKEFGFVSCVLMNVLDEHGLKTLFTQERFDCVFHAAAFKHVSVVEHNPIQGVQNNALGTYQVAKAAIDHKVPRFVLVSTDKAVNPTNVMGASKRFCELMVAWLGAYHMQTDFITTRFGNVLGSNGSVIPIFRKQIEAGGPITLTHPEITRYFMTIPEASKLVLEACRIGKDNQVFVFDMGAPVRIMDLATNMISLSGFRPNEDIEVKIVGLRPGEKLYEELLLNTEQMLPSHNPHIFISQKEELSIEQMELIQSVLDRLSQPGYADAFDLVRLMKVLIPEYKSNNSNFEVLDRV
jgi:FlaA1/EpsC-like NDP-sugar epimerase